MEVREVQSENQAVNAFAARPPGRKMNSKGLRFHLYLR